MLICTQSGEVRSDPEVVVIGSFRMGVNSRSEFPHCQTEIK